MANRLYRDIVSADLVNSLDILLDQQYQMCIASERIIKEILRDHLLDADSKSYFIWLKSCYSSIRMTIEKELVAKKDKERVAKIQLPSWKKKRKRGE